MRTQQKHTACEPGSCSSPDSESAGAVILTFLASRTVRNKSSLFISHLVHGIFVMGDIISTSFLIVKPHSWGFPWWCSGWESACRCRGHGFYPWSRKIPHASEQLSPCATTTEPTCHNYWSPRTLEPVLCSKKRHCNEKPTHHNKDPMQPKIK